MITMWLTVKICSGFLLDLMFGDPQSFHHPVRLIGRFIGSLEKRLRKFRNEKLAGILLTLIVVSTTYLLTFYISYVSIIIEIILIYTVFAAESLASEAETVYNFLKDNNISGARRQIAFLVSRDTSDMNEKDIIRATVETVSENIVDGIIAPMFFLFIGGAALGMAYKAASTLDSMTGYKNDKYINFGWASAKLDDALNFIPARIAAFLLIPAAALVCGFDARSSLRVVLRDRHNHSSPNSGHPEAAVAGAIRRRLGGQASYFGKVVNKPFIGDASGDIDKDDILKTIRIMYAASVIGLIAGSIIIIVINLFFE